MYAARGADEGVINELEGVTLGDEALGQSEVMKTIKVSLDPDFEGNLMSRQGQIFSGRYSLNRSLGDSSKLSRLRKGKSRDWWYRTQSSYSGLGVS